MNLLQQSVQEVHVSARLTTALLIDKNCYSTINSLEISTIWSLLQWIGTKVSPTTFLSSLVIKVMRELLKSQRIERTILKI